MLANLQNYLEIKHDCLLIYVNRVISQGGDQGEGIKGTDSVLISK